MKATTGDDKADANAMVEYFQPLLVWLKERNKGEESGWTLPADPLKAQEGHCGPYLIWVL